MADVIGVMAGRFPVIVLRTRVRHSLKVSTRPGATAPSIPLLSLCQQNGDPERAISRLQKARVTGPRDLSRVQSRSPQVPPLHQKQRARVRFTFLQPCGCAALSACGAVCGRIFQTPDGSARFAR